MYALKRRVLCGSFLVLIIAASVLDLHGEHSGRVNLGPSLLGLAGGLLLGVIHIPEAGVAREVPTCCKLALCGFVALATLYMATWPWHQVPGFPNHSEISMPKRCMRLVGLLLNAGIYILCILKEHPPSTYAHDAKWCMLGLWLASMSIALFDAARMAGAEDVSDCVLAFAISLDSVVLGWVLIMFQARMRMLRDVKTGCFEFWIYVMCGCFVANSIATCVQRGLSSELGLYISVVLRSIFLSIWLTYTVIVCHALSVGLLALCHESRRVRGLPKRQAQWAARVLALELFICASLGLTTFLVWFTINVVKIIELADPAQYRELRRSVWFYVSLIRRFDAALNAIELAFLSGILWQGNPPEDHDEEMESRSRLRGLTSMSDFLEVDEQVVYRLKVKELAHRGVRLRSLLDFWDELFKGEVMRSFHARQSQTNDVVRQAVIPLSRSGCGGRALAQLWEEDVKPQAMVTHNWTNSFANLLGAVIADALDLDVYAPISEQLATAQGARMLRQKLKQQDRLDRTYWVCAFSVNQHASICGGFGPEPAGPGWKAWDAKRYDSVSGERFPLCDCEEPKVFSHHDAACELNKFDDMMGFLSIDCLGFGHLIVVDEQFEVLFRAWCVAEIVEANVQKIPARIKVFSQTAVDCNYDRLSLLDVRDCSASSQADKEVILKKILDVDAFNLRLQHLVFSSQGLFSQWVDGKERSRQVGRIWRRSTCSALEDQKMARCCHFGAMFSQFSSESGESDTSSSDV